jgi:hypothetical protein
MKTLSERLWEKVEKLGEDDCWPFTGGTHKGYGQIKKKIDGRWVKYAAHRAAYETEFGDIPPGHEIDHHCNNPCCCNPAHLEAVTHSENMKRIWARGRGRSGNASGMFHAGAKFTREQVEEIKADPRSARLLARAYGCEKTTILRIRNGKTYLRDAVVVHDHP